MNELEELEQEGLDEQLLEVGGTANLPNVPSTELPAAPGELEPSIEFQFKSLSVISLHL